MSAEQLSIGDFVTVEVLAPKNETDAYTVAVSNTPGMLDRIRVGLLYAAWSALADQLDPEDLVEPPDVDA